MTSYLYIFVGLLSLCSFTNGGGREGVRGCYIPWGTVSMNSFIVRWNATREPCASYNIFVYDGYTSKINQEFRRTTISNNMMTVRNLRSFKAFGVRVQCVGSGGVVTPLSIPCHTRTLGRRPTTPPPPTGTPPVGTCGANQFTCESGQCVPRSYWCNGVKECRNGSDEKNCPGHCPEITNFHDRGNMSCSLFNSLKSACFFDCQRGWERRGTWYVYCLRSGWTFPIPTCIATFLDFFWDDFVLFRDRIGGIEMEVPLNASSVQLVSVEPERGPAPTNAQLNIISEEVTGDSVLITAEITGLRTETDYEITVELLDDYGVLGVNRTFQASTR